MIFADMTVRENLIIGGYHNPDRIRHLETVLDGFPRLRERLQQSGRHAFGRRTANAGPGPRPHVARPRLLLLDEPSMGAAPLMVKEVSPPFAR